MERHNPDTRQVEGQGDDLDRGQKPKDQTLHTILGRDILNNDELERPPEDRSPLTKP